MLFAEYRKTAIIAVRSIEMLCIGLLITGTIWSTTDFLLLYVLTETLVSPFSILLMLYGTIGTFVTEITARLLAKAKVSNNSRSAKK